MLFFLNTFPRWISALPSNKDPRFFFFPLRRDIPAHACSFPNGSNAGKRKTSEHATRILCIIPAGSCHHLCSDKLNNFAMTRYSWGNSCPWRYIIWQYAHHTFRRIPKLSPRYRLHRRCVARSPFFCFFFFSIIFLLSALITTSNKTKDHSTNKAKV